MSAPHRWLKSLAVLSVVCALISACGGGGHDSSGGTQSPLQISGVPPTTVLAGQSFSFTPSAHDAAGTTFTFSVTGLPDWAQFDSATGRITGSPTTADVGVYTGIVVSVTDGVTTVTLPPFTVSVVASAAGSALLSWTPPTQRADGSALTDLAGYRIYWGEVSGQYSNAVTLRTPGVTAYVVDQLTPATWYFAVTAFDSNDVESAYSNEASKVVQ